MMRVKGRYRNQKVELDQPLGLADGTEVEVEIYPADASLKDDWGELGMDRLEQEWNNPEDALYDDWRKLYGV
jgi:hypothetical protein